MRGTDVTVAAQRLPRRGASVVHFILFKAQGAPYMPAVTVGQLIDNYRIVRQIGEGGMGAVYEAVHVVLGQRAAIKVLTSDFRAQPALLQRFVNEARAASQINHPGIVKVYDLGHLEDGQPWLSMEYLEGQSLAERIHGASRRPGRTLGMDDFWIIGDLASALAAAHAKGIIHRDLKPANVMIVPDPATLTGDRAKVLDFGVAKLHTDQLTKRGSILGTPLYMALEQFKDSAEVSGQADVFSLGVIAYELLSGRRPHGGQTHFEVMGARLMEPITPIEQLVPSLAAPVAALVTRMLEREPTLRPSMNEVEFEVRSALGLPPPRQSGWHHAVAVEPAPEDGFGDSQPAHAVPHFDSNASTPDAPADAARGMPQLTVTPSSEKALGEISPPSAVRVPDSLSSMPSVPVAVPASLRASADARTAKPAPTPFIPEAVASPSSPTVPQPREKPGRSWLGALLLTSLAALGGATYALWPQPRPAVMSNAGTERANPEPKMVPAATPNPPAPAPPVLPPPASPDLGVVATLPERPVTAPPTTPSASRAAARPCEPQPPSLACLITPAVADEQRRQLHDALQQSGAKWCYGESLVLSGLPNAPEIVSAPPSLHGDFQLLLTLRGMLRGKKFPPRLKIQCRAR